MVNNHFRCAFHYSQLYQRYVSLLLNVHHVNVHSDSLSLKKVTDSGIQIYILKQDRHEKS